MCTDIQRNASWSQNHKDADVLLDATEALGNLVVGYINRQSDSPWSSFSGEEDDWGEETGRSVADAWLELTNVGLVTKSLAQLVMDTTCGDFMYFDELQEEWTGKGLV